jgi:hypothetical protein
MTEGAQVNPSPLNHLQIQGNLANPRNPPPCGGSWHLDRLLAAPSCLAGELIHQPLENSLGHDVGDAVGKLAHVRFAFGIAPVPFERCGILVCESVRDLCKIEVTLKNLINHYHSNAATARLVALVWQLDPRPRGHSVGFIGNSAVRCEADLSL